MNRLDEKSSDDEMAHTTVLAFKCRFFCAFGAFAFNDFCLLGSCTGRDLPNRTVLLLALTRYSFLKKRKMQKKEEWENTRRGEREKPEAHFFCVGGRISLFLGS